MKNIKNQNSHTREIILVFAGVFLLLVLEGIFRVHMMSGYHFNTLPQTGFIIYTIMHAGVWASMAAIFMTCFLPLLKKKTEKLKFADSEKGKKVRVKSIDFEKEKTMIVFMLAFLVPFLIYCFTVVMEERMFYPADAFLHGLCLAIPITIVYVIASHALKIKTVTADAGD